MSEERKESGALARTEAMREASRQARVLTARYLHCLRGDKGTLLLLLAQAPFIGWLCTIVWGSVESDTPSLHFVMALTAVWFGCINASREIVKERAIVERERFFGLSLPAYVGSKFAVLGGLGLLQVVLMQAVIESSIGVEGPFLMHTLSLWGATVAGTGLGLLASALASRQERAVAAVPLVLLPQILFSSFVIPESAFSTTVSVVEKIMPVHWSYTVFETLADPEGGWGGVLGGLTMLTLMSVILAALVIAALIPRREVT